MLQQLALRCLANHIDAIERIGDVPAALFLPVLERCTDVQLQRLQRLNPHLAEVTDALWRKHIGDKFSEREVTALLPRPLPLDGRNYERYVRLGQLRQERYDVAKRKLRQTVAALREESERNVTAIVPISEGARVPGRVHKRVYLGDDASGRVLLSDSSRAPPTVHLRLKRSRTERPLDIRSVLDVPSRPIEAPAPRLVQPVSRPAMRPATSAGPAGPVTSTPAPAAAPAAPPPPTVVKHRFVPKGGSADGSPPRLPSTGDQSPPAVVPNLSLQAFNVDDLFAP